MYNGHPTWTKWNVSLWIGNDEPLYRMMQRHIRRADNKDEAARNMFAELQEMGVSETPDGAKYSVSNIRYAMRGE